MSKRNLPFISKILVCSLSLLAFLVVTLPLAAQTGTDPLHVATSGADSAVCGAPAVPCRSLQYALAKARDGGVIKLASGVFMGVQGIPPGSDAPVLLNITKSVTIQGGFTVTNWLGYNPVANLTILDARQQGRVLRAAGHITVKVSGVSIVNGVITGGVGGGIYNDQATLTLNDVVVADNRAVGDSSGRTGGFGGGIYNAGAMIITRTTLLRNVATGGSGATGLCYAGGGGGGAGLGGGIYNLGTLTLVSTTLANNRAFGGSGGIATATSCYLARVGRGGRGGGAGGAGASSPDWPGEPGRFGGGGGGGANTSDSEDIIGYGSAGGPGGFGGGGGGKGLYEFEYPDTPGGFGGGAGDVGGGGGAGIGGALFDLNGGATLQGVVLVGNVVAGGAGGALAYQPIVGQSLVGHPGQAIGADVFTYSSGVSNRAGLDWAARAMTGVLLRRGEVSPSSLTPQRYDGDASPLPGGAPTPDVLAAPAHVFDAPAMPATPANITGRLFVDTDRNGVQDPGEDVVTTALTLTLYAYDPTAAGALGPVVDSAVSVEGWYTFTGLTSGAYVLRADGETAGLLPTTPTYRPVRLISDTDWVTLDYGLAPLPTEMESQPGQVMGQVYADANNDGQMTPGEGGLAGIAVTLTASNDVTVVATLTDGVFSLPVAYGPVTLTAQIPELPAPGGYISPGAWPVVGQTSSLSRTVQANFAVSAQPNILLIISDDQPYQTVITDASRISETVSARFMPFTRDEIFDRGAEFTRAYASTALCCPSRASMFTGLYAFEHNVITNLVPLTRTTVISYLHEQGNYYTGLVGKYLNSYIDDLVTPGSKPPEFDYWAHRCDNGQAIAGFGVDSFCYRYTSAKFNVVGHASYTPTGFHIITGTPVAYTPYVERDFVLDFLAQSALQPKPFLLIYTTLIAHRQVGIGNLSALLPLPDPNEPNPVTEDEVGKHRPPNFNPVPLGPNRPFYLQGSPPLSSFDILTKSSGVDKSRLGILNSLQALDRIVVSLTERLQQQNMLTNTVIIFISDNGYMMGEQRSQEKAKVYEESVHVPFAIRYTPFLTAHRVITDVVGNIDIAPTLLELAGISPVVGPDLLTETMSGRSLVPYLTQPPVAATPVHTNVILLGPPSESIAPQPRPPAYAGVHTPRYVYVENRCDLPELYDLDTDPWQLQNLYTEVVTASAYLTATQLHLVLDARGLTLPPYSRCGPYLPALYHP